MEGLTPEHSIRRPEKFQAMLDALAPNKFKVIIPEVLEAKLGNDDIYERDIKALVDADIIVGDLYNIGLISKEGKEKLKHIDKITIKKLKEIALDYTIRCRGTIEEISYAKCLDKYVIEILRTRFYHHPFAEAADHIASSLKDAVIHLVREFKGVKK